MPAIRAALRFPPTATARRPKVVRFNTTHPTTATMTKIRAGTGMPSTRPLPNHCRMSSSIRLMGVRSAIHKAKPRAMVSMARVAMNGTTLPQTMAAPISNAMARAPIMNIHEPYGINSPPAMLAAASADPTDRSMPPVAITNVMPMAMMPVMLAWVSTLSRLSLVRKMPGLMITPTMIRAMITIGSTSSWTGTWRKRPRASTVVVSVSTAISSPCFRCVMNRDGRLQHVLLGAGRAVEFVDNVTLTHHQYAVAEAEQLGQLTGDHDDADAVCSQVGDHSVDLRPGADIDAASRLVQ